MTDSTATFWTVAAALVLTGALLVIGFHVDAYMTARRARIFWELAPARVVRP